MANENKKEGWIKSALADFAELASEHDLTKDSSVLFADSNRIKLVRLRYASESHYVRLIDEWKAKGVKGLTELRKAVDRANRRMDRLSARARVKGDDGLVRDGAGKIIVDPANILTAIRTLGVTLCYDEFRGRPEVRGLEGFGPAFDDHAMRRLWLALESDFNFSPPRMLFDEVVLDEAYRNRFHPVRDYLDDLAFYGVWDRAPRLDRWLVTYAGAKDTPYVRAVSAIVLIAAVRRVRQPGTKFDEMTVLESAEQGYGKSSLVAALAVKEEWFSDSVPLNADDKRMIESTSGKWVCEVSELQGMRKGEIEKVRAQLSRPVDRARLAYARLPVEIPRQYVLIGTTNATAASPYLADIDGNRRFWPVEVGRCDVAGLIRDRDQIWAEAATREAAGESIRLPESLWAEAGREQSNRAVGNAFVDVLAPALGDREGVIRADDAWRIVGIPVERRDTHAGKFGKAMKSLGWERKQRRLERGHDPVWAYSKGSAHRLLVTEPDPFDHKGVLVKYQDEERVADSDY